MTKTVFESSKPALALAATIVVGTVLFVSPKGGNGMLGIASRDGDSASVEAEAPVADTAEAKPAAKPSPPDGQGWGPPAVFGSFTAPESNDLGQQNESITGPESGSGSASASVPAPPAAPAPAAPAVFDRDPPAGPQTRRFRVVPAGKGSGADGSNGARLQLVGGPKSIPVN